MNIKYKVDQNLTRMLTQSKDTKKTVLKTDYYHADIGL